MNRSGVYGVKNKVNGKVYVGRDKRLMNRWGYHRSCLRKGFHKNPFLLKDWNEFGEENFTCIVIEECENYIEREKYWIKYYMSLGLAYNIKVDDKQPKVLREKMSLSHTGKNLSQGHKKSISQSNTHRPYHSRRVLTKDQTFKTLSMLNSGMQIKEIADYFEVNYNVIQKIKHRLCYIDWIEEWEECTIE